MDFRLTKLTQNLDVFVGEIIRQKVMDGSDEIASSTSPLKKARWVKSAMERLDSLVDEQTKIKIMESCSCQTENKLKTAKSLFKNAKDLDEFLKALEQARIVGTKFERQGNIIYVFYDKCYCPLVKGSKERVSLTYCYCSNGYTKKMFEGIFDKPIRVELLESIIHGDSKCKFAVYL